VSVERPGGEAGAAAAGASTGAARLPVIPAAAGHPRGQDLVDGGEHGFHGVFHGAQTIDGMLQTWEYEGSPGHVSLDRLTFENHGHRTVVRTHSTFESVEARDAMIQAGMASGVEEGFERLEELLGRLGSSPEPPAVQ